jgi:hypothetical protein
MSDSLTEIIVERFYRASEYLVERDVPIVAENVPQFWSDLDVLAIKDEVVLVNCKDYVTDPKQKTKIADNLNLAVEWVKCRYGELVANKPITRQLVYGYSDKATIEFLEREGITCLSLEAVLGKYLTTLESKLDLLKDQRRLSNKGLRWSRIGNLMGYDKLFVYLMNQRFLKVETGQIAKWEP